MSYFITATSSGSSNIHAKVIDPNDALGHDRLSFEKIDMALVAGVIQRFWTTTFQGQALTESERQFEEQKSLFEQIPPLLLEQYRSRFVASRNGRIVDSDDDFVTLTHRFFENFGDTPVYITKIGHDDGVSIDTPFFD